MGVAAPPTSDPPVTHRAPCPAGPPEGAPPADIADLDRRDFAAIVFWHSLEHLPRPADALARAAELLAPGGVLVVAAPNSDSLQARLFKDRWLALDLPRHLVHLPARALVERLRELGLRG